MYFRKLYFEYSYCHAFTISGTHHYTHSHETVVKLFKPLTTTKINESIVPLVLCGKFRIHSCPFRRMDSMLFKFLGAFSKRKACSVVSGGSKIFLMFFLVSFHRTSRLGYWHLLLADFRVEPFTLLGRNDLKTCFFSDLQMFTPFFRV